MCEGKYKHLGNPTNGLQRLPCVFGVDVIDLSLQLQDLLRLNGDVCGLTLDTQHTVNISTTSLCQLLDIVITPMLDFRSSLEELGRPTYPGSS